MNRNVSVCLLLLLVSLTARSQWSYLSNINTPVCTAPDSQHLRGMVSDGHRGAILAWEDFRTGAGNTHVYVQRIDSAGSPRWGVNGINVTPSHTADFQIFPVIASDESGGAIVAWCDGRGPLGAYAQRINSDGILQWGSDGVFVGAGNALVFPQIVSDGSGGAIVMWCVDPHGSYDPYHNNLFVQRVNSAGVVQWGSGGVNFVDTTGSSQYHMVTDGAGGAICAWMDSRNGVQDLYAQRINNSGTPLWTSGGVPVSLNAWDNNTFGIIADGKGGAIIAYNGITVVDKSSVVGQRITSSGVLPWTSALVGGDTLADGYNWADSFILSLVSLVSDDSGGVYVGMIGNSRHAVVQHSDSNGIRLWGSRGRRLDQYMVDGMTLVRDGEGEIGRAHV
jgi:hypothetical protein